MEARKAAEGHGMFVQPALAFVDGDLELLDARLQLGPPLLEHRHLPPDGRGEPQAG